MGAGCGAFDYGTGAVDEAGSGGSDVELPVDEGGKGGDGGGATEGGGAAATVPPKGSGAVRSAQSRRSKPIRAFTLRRRVFGGRAGALVVSFRLARTERAVVDLLRGRRVVRRVSARTRKGLRTYRLRIGARGLARGSYRVRLRAGGATAILRARRL